MARGTTASPVKARFAAEPTVLQTAGVSGTDTHGALTAAQARPRRDPRGVQRFVAIAAPPPRVAHAAARVAASGGVCPSEAADVLLSKRLVQKKGLGQSAAHP